VSGRRAIGEKLRAARIDSADKTTWEREQPVVLGLLDPE
jgi:hypothetical protein